MTGHSAPSILQYMLRWPRLILEFLVVFITVTALLLGLLIWRVASQPITTTTLTPYIEMAIESLFPKTRAVIEHSLIVWDNADHSLALEGDGVSVRDSKGDVIAKFPVMKMRLSVLALLQGRFLPAEMTLTDPQLWFVRHEDGTVWFGNMETGGGEKTPASGEALSLWDALRHFSKEITHRGGLHELSVTNATLFIHDKEAARDWTIRIPVISLDYGLLSLTGVAQIELGPKDHSTQLAAHYKFDRSNKQHHVALQFRNVNPAVLKEINPQLAGKILIDMPLTGEIDVATDQELNVVTFGGKINGGEGTLVIPEMWDKPRPLKSVSVEGDYDRLSGTLKGPNAAIDFGGTKLTLTVEGKKPPSLDVTGNSPSADMAFTANLQLTDLPLDKYADVWPKPIITNASEWIVANLSKGQFKQGEATLKGHFVWNDLENITLDSAEGKITATNAVVRYLEGMPPVQGVNAEATFDLNHMDVKITSGNIGALKVLPFTIKMTDFEKNVQNIVIPVKETGPVPDVIRLIDSPPLGYAKAIGLKADDCEGQVQGTVTLRFPLLKSLLMKDVDITANAELTKFAAHNLIPKIDLTQGTLNLDLDKRGYSLKGTAALNKVPLDISWDSRFSAKDVKAGEPISQALVSGRIGDEQWNQLGLDFSDKVKGPTVVSLTYKEFSSSLASLSGQIDFKQADIQLDALNWKKKPGISALLTFSADMPANKPIQVKSIDLKGAGVLAKGSAAFDRTTQELLSLDLQPLVLGRTDATLHFQQTFGDKGALKFSAEGKSFDVSGLTGGKDPARADPRPKDYSLQLDKLYTSETGFIADVQGHAQRDKLGWNVIELHGMADGGHKLDISLKPVDGKRTFLLTCDDFGKALKGMGFTDTVKDGPIEVKGESVPENPRVIHGTVKIGHFVVSGLPALARLLSAASPFGFIDLVTGNATFDELEGKFRWQDDSVDLIKVRAVGSVFGLNIDGRVDLNSGESDLQGTMVPFSLFNRILGSIPLLGDVITGGDGGGVLAVSYAVKGTLNDPDISVNPISLLTPGFLRNLFFGSGTPSALPAKQDETPSSMIKKAP